MTIEYEKQGMVCYFCLEFWLNSSIIKYEYLASISNLMEIKNSTPPLISLVWNCLNWKTGTAATSIALILAKFWLMMSCFQGRSSLSAPGALHWYIVPGQALLLTRELITMAPFWMPQWLDLTIRTTKHQAEESQSLYYFVWIDIDQSAFPEYAKSQDQDFYMVSLRYPICTSKWKKNLMGYVC